MDDETSAIALHRLTSFEAPRHRFYRDGGRHRVPTIGIGYTPIVDAGGRWRLRPAVQAHFRAAGVALSAAHMRALRDIEAEMNAGRSRSAAIDAALAVLADIELAPAQQAALVRPVLDDARRQARAALGGETFDALDAVRRAELIVAAYQSPRALHEAGGELAAFARAGDWPGMAARFEAIGAGRGDPVRYRSGAEKLRDPRGHGRVEVRPGDTLAGIARHHGVALAALLAANPHLANPDRIRAGDVLRLPAALA